MLKLKLQYFGHLMEPLELIGKTLMLGKIEGRRKRGWQRMKWLDDITDSVDMNQEIVRDREAWWAAVQGVYLQDLATEQTNTGSKVCHIVTFILGWQGSCLFHTLNYVPGVSSQSNRRCSIQILSFLSLLPFFPSLLPKLKVQDVLFIGSEWKGYQYGTGNTMKAWSWTRRQKSLFKAGM